jgi:hypothetical protein
MSLTKPEPSLAGNNLTIPGQGVFGKWLETTQLGAGKPIAFFDRVMIHSAHYLMWKIAVITRCSLAADGACGEYGAVGAVAASAELEPALLPRMQVPVQLRVHQVQTAGQHPHSAPVRRHGKVFLFLGDKRMHLFKKRPGDSLCVRVSLAFFSIKKELWSGKYSVQVFSPWKKEL